MIAGDSAGAAKQLSTMLSRASGSQRGDSTPWDKSTTRENGCRKRMQRRSMAAAQYASRYRTDHACNSSYEFTPACCINHAMFVVAINSGVGVHPGDKSCLPWVGFINDYG